MSGEREPLLTDDIRELLRLVAQSDIGEVLIERGDARVHIKRVAPQPPVVNMLAATPQAATPAAAYPHLLAMPGAASAPFAAPEQSAPVQPTGITVTAPMVGTFYASPAPKDPPYVSVGDEVRPGDVLGIIEAMKIMNEIECEVHGTVAAVLVDTGQPVEYGQPLLVIEPLQG